MHEPRWCWLPEINQSLIFGLESDSKLGVGVGVANGDNTEHVDELLSILLEVDKL